MCLLLLSTVSIEVLPLDNSSLCPLPFSYNIFFPPARAAREAPGGINILRTFAPEAQHTCIRPLPIGGKKSPLFDTNVTLRGEVSVTRPIDLQPPS